MSNPNFFDVFKVFDLDILTKDVEIKVLNPSRFKEVYKRLKTKNPNSWAETDFETMIQIELVQDHLLESFCAIIYSDYLVYEYIDRMNFSSKNQEIVMSPAVAYSLIKSQKKSEDACRKFCDKFLILSDDTVLIKKDSILISRGKKYKSFLERVFASQPHFHKEVANIGTKFNHLKDWKFEGISFNKSSRTPINISTRKLMETCLSVSPFNISKIREIIRHTLAVMQTSGNEGYVLNKINKLEAKLPEIKLDYNLSEFQIHKAKFVFGIIRAYYDQFDEYQRVVISQK